MLPPTFARRRLPDPLRPPQFRHVLGTVRRFLPVRDSDPVVMRQPCRSGSCDGTAASRILPVVIRRMLQLGENLARIRTARGLTQEELAQSSGVSVGTISRLERGVHTTARRSTLAALARALGVDPARLLGIHPSEQDTAEAEQLRRAVRALDLPDFAEPAEMLALPELHDAASGAWSDYFAGRHAKLLAGLPALMVDTRRAVHHLADDQDAEAAGLLTTAYRLAAGLSGWLGLVDLAAHAAHRALDTARFTTQPELDEAAALRYLA